MATYTLTPNNWSKTGSVTITNNSNAYADTSSTNYATVEDIIDSVSSSAYLRGFDFSTIQSGEVITSITVKVKLQRSYSSSASQSYVRLVSTYGSSGIALSDDYSIKGGSTSTVTLTLTISISEILQYANNKLSIKFGDSGGSTNYRVYGAEIIVETSPPTTNKVVYGNETLIDLTGDTATELDVASGKTFHLANGFQATGVSASGARTSSITKTLSSNETSITFTGLVAEPKCFIVRSQSNVTYNSSTSNYKIVYVTYDGTNTTGAYLRGGTNTSTSGVIYNDTKYSFTYSSGSLTVSSSGSSTSAGGGFIIGEWELIYAY